MSALSTLRGLPEGDLIHDCLAGDQPAWEEMYRRLHQPVRRIVAWRKWCFTPSEVEDVVQDVFLELVRILASFRRESSLMTFVTRLSKNKCVSHLRRKTALKRGKEVLGVSLEERRGDDETRVVLAIDPEPLADEVVVQREEVSQMLACLDTLSTECRQVIQARYFQDKSYDEICRELGLPLGTLCSRLKRCLDRLRGMFEREMARP